MGCERTTCECVCVHHLKAYEEHGLREGGEEKEIEIKKPLPLFQFIFEEIKLLLILEKGSF